MAPRSNPNPDADTSWIREIRRRMLDQRLSGQDVAERADLTRQAFHAIMQGRSSPKLDTVERIASALGCTVRDLFPPDRPAAPPAQEGEVLATLLELAKLINRAK